MAVAVWTLMPAFSGTGKPAQKVAKGEGRSGFGLLLAIGVLDSGVRMGFLTFLLFVLKAKGADLPLVGLALTLVLPAAPQASSPAAGSAPASACS